jgi:cyclopropane-fatty-acyl-phospholipid synthase
MAEHVGTGQLAEYFAAAYRALKPGGLFLNHAIADTSGPNNTHGVLAGKGHESFIARHVFPDGELQPIHDTLAAAEDTGFEVTDLQSLRRHYALTLRHWLRRLEARRGEALAAVDEVTYRVWQLYMAGAAYNFAHGHLTIFQTLLARPDERGNIPLPLTRADLYEGSV